jgi:hypothetical protein
MWILLGTPHVRLVSLFSFSFAVGLGFELGLSHGHLRFQVQVEGQGRTVLESLVGNMLFVIFGKLLEQPALVAWEFQKILTSPFSSILWLIPFCGHSVCCHSLPLGPHQWHRPGDSKVSTLGQSCHLSIHAWVYGQTHTTHTSLWLSLLSTLSGPWLSPSSLLILAFPSPSWNSPPLLASLKCHPAPGPGQGDAGEGGSGRRRRRWGGDRREQVVEAMEVLGAGTGERRWGEEGPRRRCHEIGGSSAEPYPVPGGILCTSDVMAS